MKIIYSSNERFSDLWNKGVQSLKGATIFYTALFRNYERITFGKHLKRDDSFVIVSSNDEVQCIVPLYAFEVEGKLDYRYGIEYLRGPLVSDSPKDGNVEDIRKKAIETVIELARKNGIRKYMPMIEPVEFLEGRVLSNYTLDLGFRDEAGVANVINCQKSEDTLWSGVRKSYRPLINRADRQYLTFCVSKENYDEALCEAYRHLHTKAAGKQTRSTESFKAMYDMVKSGLAFIVIVRDENEKTVGTYFFYMHQGYGFYGSAATDPGLGSQSGVGHLGLWKGILLAKKFGCRDLDLGQLLVRPDLTQKEINIDLFKQGFGGERVVVFRSALDIQS